MAVWSVSSTSSTGTYTISAGSTETLEAVGRPGWQTLDAVHRLSRRRRGSTRMKAQEVDCSGLGHARTRDVGLEAIRNRRKWPRRALRASYGRAMTSASPPMRKPLALDLFSGAGGSARGLQMAGFEVIGIDNRPQLHYAGDHFVLADALRPPVRLEDFAFVWASPPCQHASIGSRRWVAAGRAYPALIEPTRTMLEASGVPYVIENVPGAAVRADVVLTGEMFGLRTHRRRHFELGGWWSLAAARPPRLGPKTAVGWCTVAGHGGHGPNRLDAWSEAMGIYWMTKDELAQAIPPAYSRWIGEAFLAQLAAKIAPPRAVV